MAIKTKKLESNKLELLASQRYSKKTNHMEELLSIQWDPILTQ